MKTFSFLAFLIFGNWSILFTKDNNFMEKRVRLFFKHEGIEAGARRRSVKKVFLEISQNSLENTCHRASFLIKLQTLFKKRLWHRCFPVNFAKFLRTPFLQNTSGRLCFWKNTRISLICACCKNKDTELRLSHLHCFISFWCWL